MTHRAMQASIIIFGVFIFFLMGWIIYERESTKDDPTGRDILLHKHWHEHCDTPHFHYHRDIIPTDPDICEANLIIDHK